MMKVLHILHHVQDGLDGWHTYIARGREVLFVELNFGVKAADDFKAVMTSYYDFYGLVSEQRAEYVCTKTRVLLEKIFSALDETL